jgi:hypothetical protein
MLLTNYVLTVNLMVAVCNKFCAQDFEASQQNQLETLKDLESKIS